MSPIVLKFCILLFSTLFHLVNNASLDVGNKYQEFTGDQGLYTHKDDVEILTENNFKDAIIGSNRAWFVEFYNSWCGFCQRFAPSWKELATDIYHWRDMVVVAAINCANDQNYPLCRDYEIMAYPTLRYYPEGFEETPKNYGKNINRGVTAGDHRYDLVREIMIEQKQGRGKQFPDISPFSGSNIQAIFHGAASDIKIALLLIQEPESLLGPQLLLDLHKTPHLITKYAYSNNTDLIAGLPHSGSSSLHLIEKKKEAETLRPPFYDRKDILDFLKEKLKERDIEINFETEKEKKEKLQEKQQEVNDLLEKIKKMGDAVFQMDLETALRYSLKREVGGLKEITGEKLQALRTYVQVLAKYFPFGINGKALLQEISALVEASDPVEGNKIGTLVRNAENESRQVFSTPQKWLACQGSSPQYRGYPCGLWRMFHYLTVNVADYSHELRGDNPRLVLEAMHGYIKNFFGCADCSQHFQEMAAKREIFKVSSFDNAILWLWEAHNEVNNRLSGDPTEDPDFPKLQFPSEKNCQQCRKSDGSWDSTEVLKYLKHIYSNVNISYLGADTKVIYLGLEESANNSAGLQTEDVQIQTRPVGQGLTRRSDGMSSATTTKDKAFLRLLTFLVLTVSGVFNLWARN
ncbi:sulfhydryl oxidase 2-like [Euwallacea similis]|uniref:sulfhydryl oxidase 2-like n=1 Tax=Euwallacea similis TaxID=1736056 RepID=UPI00344EC5BF